MKKVLAPLAAVSLICASTAGAAPTERSAAPVGQTEEIGSSIALLAGIAVAVAVLIFVVLDDDDDDEPVSA